MKKVILMILIISLNINFVSSFSLSGSGNCICDTCLDCENALNSSSCYTSIKLGNDIEASSDLCIKGQYLTLFQEKIIDCDGYNISGLNNYSAIFLYENDYITIKNCIVDYITVFYSDYITIKDNNFYAYYGGLDFLVSGFSNVNNNNFNNCFYGLTTVGLSYSEIKSNNFYNNTYAVSLWEVSTNNIFDGNIILNSDSMGIKILFGNSMNTFSNNKICDSGEYDIFNEGVNTGIKNICDTFYIWKDNSVDVGCSDSCIIEECFCDSCADCENKLNSPNCRKVVLLNDIISNEICINGSSLINFTNKVLNCNNYAIKVNESGESKTAIALNNNEGNSILNCNIEYFTTGIFLNNSAYTSIDNFNLNYNANATVIYNSNNVFIKSSNIQNNSRYGIYIYKSNNSFIIDNFIYGNVFDGIKIYYSSFVEVIGNIIVLNRGGLYTSAYSDYVKIYQNIMCLNQEKALNYFDIEIFGSNNYGDENTCDNSFQWNDEGAYKCSSTCLDEYESTESILEGDESDIGNISEGINIERIINEGLGDAGIKGDNSYILLSIIIKIFIDVILLLKKIQWSALIIINFFILLFFAIIGWIPFWVVILIMMVSIGFFMINLSRD